MEDPTNGGYFAGLDFDKRPEKEEPWWPGPFILGLILLILLSVLYGCSLNTEPRSPWTGSDPSFTIYVENQAWSQVTVRYDGQTVARSQGKSSSEETIKLREVLNGRGEWTLDFLAEDEVRTRTQPIQEGDEGAYVYVSPRKLNYYVEIF